VHSHAERGNEEISNQFLEISVLFANNGLVKSSKSTTSSGFSGN